MIERKPARSGSFLVGAGILTSRLAGLVRETALAGVLGISPATDAIRNAVKIPNLLQNLLGEGTLSASFIPVYADLIERGETRRASRLAGSIAGALLALTTALVLAGVLLAGTLTSLIAPGLTPVTRDLTVPLVKITTVGAGVLVFSAWCLGVLNTHRRFFLSYVAPVVWNVAQISVLVFAAIVSMSDTSVVNAVAWAMLVGAVLQVAVQLPTVISVAPDIRLGFGLSDPDVRDVGRRFTPVLLGRGVVQISAFVDVALASLLAVGAISMIGFAQIFYILPVSVFAMSIAAAELPEMSRMKDDPAAIVAHTTTGLRRIAFFMMFTVAAYLSVGRPVIGALFQRGEFGPDDTISVWLTLSAMAIGLPAVGASRLLQNTMYAVGDTRGPAKIAAMRVGITAAVGFALMFPFDRLVVSGGGFGGSIGGFGPLAESVRSVEGVVHLGAVGLALGLALSAWTEFVLLDRLARRHLPSLGPTIRPAAALATASAMAFMTGAILSRVVNGWPLLLGAIVSLGGSGLVYIVVAFRTGIREADLVLRPIRRILWR